MGDGRIVNAVLYQLRGGAAWRMMPPWGITYHYWRAWRKDGTWERAHGRLIAYVQLLRSWDAYRADTCAHEPLTTGDTWTKVQQILDGRKSNHTGPVRREFPFTGLNTCGHCGCAMVAELKKGKYVYYHCSGQRGKCPEPKARESAIKAKTAEVERIDPQAQHALC